MIIAIGGPTATGKSRLGVHLAKTFGGEIVNADSVQLYEGLDIGSAKMLPSEREGVPHHLISAIPANGDFSVACFQRAARKKFEEIQERKRIPFLVGGTGFYQKSVLHDFRFENTLRDDEEEERLSHLANEELHERLQAKDPHAAAKIHKNNRRRLLHALTRAEKGNPLGKNLEGKKPLYDYLMIVLTMEREKLYGRIGKRVDEMFEKGLLEEARSLYDQGDTQKAREAIGYKECFAFFDGLITLHEAKDRIKQNTRRFAKRQLTYFQNQFEGHWIEVDPDDFEKTCQEAKRILDGKLPRNTE